MALEPDQLPIAGLTHRAVERAEQPGISLGVPERLSRRVECGDAAFGQKEPHRTVH